MKKAFSLVELSIVLVILGLLVGGVLSGQALIRAAELRGVASAYSKYFAAATTFKDKYFSIPGDLTNAATLWGAADGSTGSTAGCATTIGTGTQTCNGNGNERIDLAAASSNEGFRFWQHLANAGMIEGNYDGVAHGSTNYSTTPANSPVGRINSSIWYATYWGRLIGYGVWFDNDYGNVFEFGGITVNGDPFTAIMTPPELWSTDTKLDDGKPATGKVLIRGTTSVSNCTDAVSTATLTANYLLTNIAPACVLVFRQQY